jgi:O-antigen ligase
LLIIRVSDRSNTEAGNRKAGSMVLSKQLSSIWRRWAVGLSGIGLGISFGLMHRSVWVCMIAGIVLLALLDQRHRADLARVFSVFAIAGFVILIPLGLLGFLDSFVESMGAAFTETTERHSSFADRYMGWEVLLGEWWSSGNILTYALGQPFGSGYYRKIAEFGSSYSAEYTPHNFYVQTLLRTGIIGLLLLVSLIISTGAGVYQTLFKMKKDRGLEFSVGLFLLLSILMQVVFFMAYGARLEQGLLFGLAMGAASVKVRLHDSSFSSKRLMSCRQ